ncbi:MAG: CobD/CbiB family protein, partial [Betaproteobacteria bacterium]
RLARDLNAGRSIHGTAAWFLAAVPSIAIVLALHYVFMALHPILATLWDIAVLYACISFRQITQEYTAIADALRASDLDQARALLARWRAEPTAQWTETEIARAAIETFFVRAHRELLAEVAWFAVLPGPAGAVLYRLASLLAERWGRRSGDEFRDFGRFSAQAFHVLDWVPLRMTAIGFAIAGDFEDAIQCWRSQFRSWLDPEAGVMLASGAGALGVRLGGPLTRDDGVVYRAELGTGDDPDANYMQSAIGLVWRTLVIYLIVLFLVTLVHWVAV